MINNYYYKFLLNKFCNIAKFFCHNSSLLIKYFDFLIVFFLSYYKGFAFFNVKYYYFNKIIQIYLLINSLFNKMYQITLNLKLIVKIKEFFLGHRRRVI